MGQGISAEVQVAFLRGIKGIKPQHPVSDRELLQRNKELERELKKKEKLLIEEKEKVEILKKSLHIFMQLPE